MADLPVVDFTEAATTTPDYRTEYDAPAAPDYRTEYAAPLDHPENYDTALSPAKEEEFKKWKAQYAPNDSGADYDLRGAFAAGLTPDAKTGHWPDTFKKPNHPTFSDESRYAIMHPELAGHWNGDTYVPPAPPPPADYRKEYVNPQEKFDEGPSHPVDAAFDDLKRYAKEEVVGIGHAMKGGARYGAEITQALDKMGQSFSSYLGLDKPLYETQIDDNGKLVRVPVNIKRGAQQVAEQQAVERKQNLVQGLAQGQEFVNLGREGYSTNPLRDKSWDAQLAEMGGQLAPATLAGPLAPLFLASQMREQAHEAALKAGDAPDVAEAKGKLNGVAGYILSKVPHMPVRQQAGAFERVITHAVQGGTLNTIQDAVLQQANATKLDWSQLLKSGAFGMLAGGLLSLPGELDRVISYRNQPHIKEAKDFGFKGPVDELSIHGRTLQIARAAGYGDTYTYREGQGLRPEGPGTVSKRGPDGIVTVTNGVQTPQGLYDWIKSHNDRVNEALQKAQAEGERRANAAAGTPPKLDNLLPEGTPPEPAALPAPAPEPPPLQPAGAEILRRAGEAGLPVAQPEPPAPPEAPPEPPAMPQPPPAGPIILGGPAAPEAPAPVAEPAVPAGPEPHEMTPEEYAAYHATLMGHQMPFVPAVDNPHGRSIHGQAADVFNALKAGKTVPPEVMARVQDELGPAGVAHGPTPAGPYVGRMGFSASSYVPNTGVEHITVPKGQFGDALHLGTDQTVDGRWSVSASLTLHDATSGQWYSSHDDKFPAHGYPTREAAAQAGYAKLQEAMGKVKQGSLSDRDKKLFIKMQAAMVRSGGEFGQAPAEPPAAPPAAPEPAKPFGKRKLLEFAEHDRPMVKIYRELEGEKSARANSVRRDIEKYLTQKETVPISTVFPYMADLDAKKLAQNFSMETLKALRERLLRRSLLADSIRTVRLAYTDPIVPADLLKSQQEMMAKYPAGSNETPSARAMSSMLGIVHEAVKLKEAEAAAPAAAPTQGERVGQALAAGQPKTANQLAEELDIINHNVRRILGEGVKAGKFVRIAPGVYGMKNPNGSYLYVESTDAVKHLPELAARGVKVDFVFLDPPYKTAAVVGGNRGVKSYNFITPDNFNTVVAATKEMLRTPESPVYYMFSQAPSGMRQMNAYTAAFEQNGLKLVAMGSWKKTTKSGKGVTNVRGVESLPEGLALFTASGRGPKAANPESLKFTITRPKTAGAGGRISQKPFELYNQLLGFSTGEVPPEQRPNFISMDPFAGTGGLAAASQQHGVSNISFEIDDKVVQDFISPKLEAGAATAPPAVPVPPDEKAPVPANSGPVVAPKPAQAAEVSKLADKKQLKVQKEFLTSAIKAEIPKAPDTLNYTQEGQEDLALLEAPGGIERLAPKYSNAEFVFKKRNDLNVKANAPLTNDHSEYIAGQIQQRHAEHITVVVPGDGVFRVPYAKPHLTAFADKVGKRFGTGMGALYPAGGYKAPRPTSLPAVGSKPDVATVTEAVQLSASEDKTREVLVQAVKDGAYTVATDGKRLTVALGGGGLKLDENMGMPGTKDEKGKPMKYPNWRQVLPKYVNTKGDKISLPKEPLGPLDMTVDTGELLRTVMLAAQSASGAIKLHVLPALAGVRGAELGITAQDPDFGQYATANLADTSPADLKIGVDPYLLMDALRQARMMGAERVRIIGQDESSPIVITDGKSIVTVTMPVRLSQHTADYDSAPEPEPSATTEPRTGQAPSLEEIGDRPGAQTLDLGPSAVPAQMALWRWTQLRDMELGGQLTAAGAAEMEKYKITIGRDFLDHFKGMFSASRGAAPPLDLLAPDGNNARKLIAFGDAATSFLNARDVLGPTARRAITDLLKGIWERELARQLFTDLGTDRELADALKSISAGHTLEIAAPGRLGAPFGEQPQPAAAGGGVVGPVSTVRLDSTNVVNTFTREGHIPLIGQLLGNIHRFVAAAQILRNPANEVLWLNCFDAEGRLLAPIAVTSRLPNSVQWADEKAFPMMMAHMKKVGAVSVHNMHNHPAGLALGSDEDIAWTKRFAAYLDRNWVGPNKPVYHGHIIINHGTYSVIGPDGTSTPYQIPEIMATPDPTRRAVPGRPYLGRKLETARQFIELGHELQSGPDNVLLALRGASGEIVGVASVHVADLDHPNFGQHLREIGRQVGAVNAYAYAENPTALTMARIADLQGDGTISQLAYKEGGIVKLTKGTFVKDSYFGTQPMAPTLRLAQSTAPYDDTEEEPMNDGAPFHLVDPDNGATTPINLGHMDMVPAVQMPELIQLTKMLCGTIPSLKNLPRAHGLFAHVPGQWGKIVLNRRVFADWEQATKTLAHEIGHLTDYMDAKHLNRGNILGRLASLRGYLEQSLPIRRGYGPPVTAKERDAMKKQAVKDAGKQPPKTDKQALAAWKDAVRKSYGDRLQAELVKRNLAFGAELKGMPQVVGVGNAHREVKAVSDWWRPWDEANAGAHEKAYRNSSVEQYADFISVLFNTPETLKKMAPTAWDLFFHYIDAKPQAATELWYVWDMIHRGAMAVSAERTHNLNTAFAKGEEVLLNKAAERKARHPFANGRVVWTALKQQHYDIFRPAVEMARAARAAGHKIPWHEDPEFVFDAHPMVENVNYRMLNRVAKTVVDPLSDVGLTTQDLGDFQYHNRLLEEAYSTGERQTGRVNMAHPQGHTPMTARQELLAMRYRLGPARMEKLVAAARQFSELMHEAMVNGHDAGIYSDEQLELANKNKYNYVTFAVLDYLMVNGKIPAGIKKQQGTLKDVANPFTATLVKMMTANKLAEHNRAKAVYQKLATDYFPDTIQLGKTYKLPLKNGRVKIMNVDPPDGWEPLVIFDHGKPVTWWVRQHVIDMFEGRMPSYGEALTGMMSWAWRNIFYPAFLTYNPGYQLYLNPVRDLKRSYVNLPKGVSRAKFLGEQIKASATSRERMMNDMTGADLQRRRALRALQKRRPLTKREESELHTLDARALAIEIMVNRGLSTPYESFAHGPATNDYWGHLLREYKLLEGEKQANFFRQYILGPLKLGGLADRLDQAGMLAEAMPKAAAYKVLTRDLGWHPPVAAHYIRNHIGTPNHLKKGSWAALDGVIIPFNNVTGKGFTSDYWQATGQAVGGVPPAQQRAEWWRRMTEAVILPRLLMGLAAAGVLGKTLQRTYAAASRYDKANYLMLPAGVTVTGDHGYKGIFFRMPEDETGRVIGGVTYNLTQMAFNNDPRAQSSMSDLLNTFGGVLPGQNPLITLGESWKDYMDGINPSNGYKGNTVMTDNQWNRGGWARLEGMAGYTLDTMGITNYVRWDKDARTISEQGIGAAPVFNRMIKITDQGLSEMDDRGAKIKDETRSQIRATMPTNVNMLMAEYTKLSLIPPAERPPATALRYMQLQLWHSQLYAPYQSRMEDMPRDQWKAQAETLGRISDPWKRRD